MSNILYIDGRNLIGKLKQVYKDAAVPEPSWEKYDFDGLFSLVLDGFVVNERRIYFAKLQQHPKTRKKSKELIEERRYLKLHLEQTSFNYIVAGNVRAHEREDVKGKKHLVFAEKGVDTRIVADVVEDACDRKLGVALIVSSDSDLQPAMRLLKRRNIESVYVGFEINPNAGMTHTASRSVIIRNAEVLSSGGLKI